MTAFSGTVNITMGRISFSLDVKAPMFVSEMEELLIFEAKSRKAKLPVLGTISCYLANASYKVYIEDSVTKVLINKE